MEAESHLRGTMCFSTFSDTKETGGEVEYKKFRWGQPSSKTRDSGLFVHERSAGEGGRPTLVHPTRWSLHKRLG